MGRGGDGRYAREERDGIIDLGDVRREPTQPHPTQPGATDPSATEQHPTEPGATEPGVSQPGATERGAAGRAVDGRGGSRRDAAGRDGTGRDVIELGGPPRDGRPGPPWRRWPTLALAATALLAAVVIVQVRRPDAGAPATAPTPSAVAASPAGPTPDPGGSTPPPAAVTEVGGPLLGVTAGWELFGSGPEEVVRVELARGRVTRTDIGPMNSDGPMSFVVGPDWAMLRPWDAVAGYLVPDGRPASTLTGALAGSGPAMPGPDPGTVWAQAGDGTAMALVDATGRPVGASIQIPSPVFASVQSDLAGYLLFAGTGGVYSTRPGAVRRITTGELLAVGPTRWLVLECDDRYRCGPVVIDRRTGARRTLDFSVDRVVASAGVISPDGRTAAVTVTEPGGATGILLVDLVSGATRHVGVSVGPGPSGVMVWAPDSRWLFAVGANRWLYPVDTATGVVHDLGVELPSITQLAIRPAAP